MRAASITHILSSPLLRALATAHIIAETLKHQSVEVWRDLREGFDDEYYGSSRADLLSRFPLAALPASMPDDGWIYTGDTRETFAARCRDMLARIGTRFMADDCVVVVTHGGFAHYLLKAILRSPPDTPVWFDMANGALTHIRFLQKQDREEWPLYPAFEAEILAMNDVAHVRPASRGAVQTCVTSSLVETSEA